MSREAFGLQITYRNYGSRKRVAVVGEQNGDNIKKYYNRTTTRFPIVRERWNDERKIFLLLLFPLRVKITILASSKRYRTIFSRVASRLRRY